MPVLVILALVSFANGAAAQPPANPKANGTPPGCEPATTPKDDTITCSTELGWRTTSDFDRSWGSIRPHFSLAWLHEFDIGADRLSGNFLGAPDSGFTLLHDRGSDDGLRVGLGIDVVDDRDRFFTLKWSEERIRGFADSSLFAKFGLQF